MLHGRILRSPHAHARIISIDTSAAEAAEGVKAIVTSADFATPDDAGIRDIRDNCLALDKGIIRRPRHRRRRRHQQIRRQSRDPFDPRRIRNPAPCHRRRRGDETRRPNCPNQAALLKAYPLACPKTSTPTSNSATVFWTQVFANADKIIERTFKTAATHQGYIEPQACMANLGADGRGELWCCTQGQYMVRENCAAIVGIEASQLRVTSSEIGGGFGGKTTTFIEPVALALSRKSANPSKSS